MRTWVTSSSTQQTSNWSLEIKALAENHLNGIPVRVHRGKAHVPDMPLGFRYRYDGLYALRNTGKRLDKTVSKFGGFVLRRH
jgi:hypothetical protein